MIDITTTPVSKTCYLVAELFLLLLLVSLPVGASAQNPEGFRLRYEGLTPQWGGHVKIRAASSWVDNETVYQTVGTGVYIDGNIEGRLKNRLSFGNWGRLDTHYEVMLYGGDTREADQKLKQLYPHIADALFLKGPVNDAGRFFDLTAVLSEGEAYVVYHRLDRLVLTLQPGWGSVRIGRQAVTWGNGFLFNPMDLFNPFAPTDVDRDYKMGDDLLAAQVSIAGDGDFQFLLVPRRDPSSGDVEPDFSSMAGKLHIAWRTTEFDFMAAKHYKDKIVGIGTEGYFMSAAWRLDATCTFLDEQSPSDDFVSLVANLDYAWTWGGKNFYGYVEIFYSGLGQDNYSESLANPDILKRLARGEMFTLGRNYLGGMIQAEVHPLFNVYLTVINNTADPSGIVQPRASWDIITNLQLIAGGSIYYGGANTEYGGFNIPGTPFLSKPADRVYAWLVYYF